MKRYMDVLKRLYFKNTEDTLPAIIVENADNDERIFSIENELDVQANIGNRWDGYEDAVYTIISNTLSDELLDALLTEYREDMSSRETRDVCENIIKLAQAELDAPTYQLGIIIGFLNVDDLISEYLNGRYVQNVRGGLLTSNYGIFSGIFPERLVECVSLHVREIAYTLASTDEDDIPISLDEVFGEYFDEDEFIPVMLIIVSSYAVMGIEDDLSVTIRELVTYFSLSEF